MNPRPDYDPAKYQQPPYKREHLRRFAGDVGRTKAGDTIPLTDGRNQMLQCPVVRVEPDPERFADYIYFVLPDGVQDDPLFIARHRICGGIAFHTLRELSDQRLPSLNEVVRSDGKLETQSLWCEACHQMIEHGYELISERGV